MRRVLFLFALLALIALIAPPASAHDVVIERSIVGIPGGPKKLFFIESYSPTRQRVDILSRANGTPIRLSLYDDEKREFSMVDETKKTYTTVTIADLQQMATEREANGEKLAPVEFVPAGPKKRGTWRCTAFRVRREKTVLGELCVVPFAQVGIEEKDLAVLKNASSFVASRVANDDTWMHDLARGLPVWAHADGITMSVVRVSKAPPDAKRFALPDDFRRLELRSEDRAAASAPTKP